MFIPNFPINLISANVLKRSNIFYNGLTRGLYQVAPSREPALVAIVTKMYGLLVIEFNPIEAYDTAFPIMVTPITRNLYPSDILVPPAL